jgi:hypothetical protein
MYVGATSVPQREHNFFTRKGFEKAAQFLRHKSTTFEFSTVAQQSVEVRPLTSELSLEFADTSKSRARHIRIIFVASVF